MIKKYKKDLFVILLILIFAGISWLAIHIVNQEKGKYLEISVREKVWKVIPLEQDGVYKIYGKTGVNTLVVEDKTAYIETADCPDKLCVKQGKISENGESIICLPHQIVVRIISDKESGVDAYAK